MRFLLIVALVLCLLIVVSGKKKNSGKKDNEDKSVAQDEGKAGGKGGTEKSEDKKGGGKGGNEKSEDKKGGGKGGSEKSEDKKGGGKGGNEKSEDKKGGGKGGNEKSEDKKGGGKGGSVKAEDKKGGGKGGSVKSEDKKGGKGGSEKSENKKGGGKGGSKKSVDKEGGSEGGSKKSGDKTGSGTGGKGDENLAAASARGESSRPSSAKSGAKGGHQTNSNSVQLHKSKSDKISKPQKTIWGEISKSNKSKSDKKSKSHKSKSTNESKSHKSKGKKESKSDSLKNQKESQKLKSDTEEKSHKPNSDKDTKLHQSKDEKGSMSRISKKESDSHKSKKDKGAKPHDSKSDKSPESHHSKSSKITPSSKSGKHTKSHKSSKESHKSVSDIDIKSHHSKSSKNTKSPRSKSDKHTKSHKSSKKSHKSVSDIDIKSHHSKSSKNTKSPRSKSDKHTKSHKSSKKSHKSDSDEDSKSRHSKSSKDTKSPRSKSEKHTESHKSSKKSLKSDSDEDSKSRHSKSSKDTKSPRSKSDKHTKSHKSSKKSHKSDSDEDTKSRHSKSSKDTKSPRSKSDKHTKSHKSSKEKTKSRHSKSSRHSHGRSSKSSLQSARSSKTSSCICMATGDPHFTTFDGETFDFQGACKYLLSRLNVPGCQVSVESKLEHRKNNIRVSWVRSIDIKHNETTVTLAPFNGLLIDGVSENFPYDDGNFKITFYNKQLYAEVLGCDFIVSFDGEKRASVFAPRIHGENLDGLCGNCNNEPRDDFTMANTTDVYDHPQRSAVWGQYWEVDDDSEPDFVIATCSQVDVHIICSPENDALANEYCDRIRNPAGPFGVALEQGWIQETAEQNFQSCKTDVCNELEDGGDAIRVACQMIESFNKWLEENGEETGNIHADGFCEIKCGANMEYKQVLECPRTCAHAPDEEVTCAPAAESGCACKDGFVLSGTECVPNNMCGCKMGKGRFAKYYKVGDFFLSRDCKKKYVCVHENGVSSIQEENLGPCLPKVAMCRGNKKTGVRECMCKKGLVGDGRQVCEKECGKGRRCHKDARCVRRKGMSFCKCKKPLTGNGETECAKKCECTASGDPHYNTHDGTLIHFQGNCTYLLSNAGNDECRIITKAKNQPLEREPTVSTTKTVFLDIFPSNTNIVIDQGPVVYIDGQKRTATSVDGPDYTITWEGSNVIVRHKFCDLTSMFNGHHTARVVIGKEFGSDAFGICGDCNGDQTNDFLTRNRTDVSQEKNKGTLVGNSFWEPMPYETEEWCLAKEEEALCPAGVMEEIASNPLCGYIKDENGPFGEYIAQFTELGKTNIPENFFQSCQFDVCLNWDDEDERVRQACDNLEAFMEESYNYFIGPIDFRTPEFCPMTCGRNMVYTSAMLMTRPSCDDMRVARFVQGPIMEGCVCANDQLLYDPGRDECVEPRECGCTYGQSDYISVGDSIVNSDCTQEFTCVREGGAARLDARPLPGCNEHEECQPRQGVRKCVCAPGFKKIDGVCQEVCDDDREVCHKHAICNRKKKPKCKCKKPWSGDGIKNCDDICVCTAKGDPHFKSFDGIKYDFQGNCTYQLTKAGNDLCGMNVQAKNQPLLKRKNKKKKKNRPPVSTTKMIIVEMKPSTDRVIIGQKKEVYVNGQRKYGNYETPYYKIVTKGKFKVIISKCNPAFKAEFDGGADARVYIPRDVGPAAVGMCGSCDRDKLNDWITKNSTPVHTLPKKERGPAIGNSWWIPSANDTRPECRDDGEPPECDDATNNNLANESNCGFMNTADGPFAECMTVNPGLFEDAFEDCMFDACAAYPDVEEQICNAMGSLYIDCQAEANVAEFNFRSENFCPPSLICPHNTVYIPATNQNPPSCQVPNPESDGSPVEACGCEGDLILDDDLMMCVTEDRCGCFDNNNNYHPIDTYFVNEDCTIQTTCVHEGGVSVLKNETRDACGDHQECRPGEDGVNDCFCEDGYEMIGGVCQLIGNCNVGHFFNEATETCEECPAGSFSDTMGSRSCTPCPEGQFQSEPGQAFCDPCGAGSFSSSEGSAVCTPCAPGQHQPAPGQTSCVPCGVGTFSSSGQSECTACQDGSYAGPGSVFCTNCAAGQTSNEDKSGCIDCEAGTFSAMPGSGSCSPCPAGQFQGDTGQTECNLCAPGSISAMGAEMCTQCSEGEYQDLAGQAQCKPCEAGSFSDMAGSDQCTPCSNGEYQDLSGQTQCKQCAAGFFSDTTGSTQCEECAAGAFSDMEGSAECTLCSNGEYQDLTGQTQCKQCAAGSFSDMEGSTQCEECAAGSFSDMAGSAQCTPCPNGEYQDLTGQTQCKQCAAGSFSDMEGSTQCDPCAAGSFSAMAGSAQCDPCPAGSFSASAGSSQCDPCAAGSFSAIAGSTECELCVAGTFSAVAGSTQCELCVAGSFSAVAGSSQCDPCAAGSFSAIAGSAQCDPCAAGSFSATAGSTQCDPCATGSFSDLPGSTQCDSCAAGSFANVEGSTQCTPCPAGSFSNVVGSSQCSPCTEGYEQPLVGQTSCTPCAAGSYSGNPGTPQCSLCPEGKYQPSAGQSSCDDCPAGQFSNVEGSLVCMVCPAGSHQPLAGQTSCILCAAGSFSGLGSAICTPCPEGMFADTAGSDDCTPCAAGNFAGVTGSEQCTPCGLGQQQPNMGQSSCETCPPGHIADTIGTVQCSPCPAGQQANMAATACEVCPSGTVSAGGEQCAACGPDAIPTQDQTDCIDCPTGTNPNQDLTACVGYCDVNPNPCLRGGTCLNADNANGYTCICPLGWTGTICETRVPIGIPSPPGEGQPPPPPPIQPPLLDIPTATPSSGGPTGCPPGEHLIGGACEFCPKGTVKPEPGQLPCQECEKGTYQDMEGQQACKPCGLGYFTDTTGQEVCKQCPSGMFANTPGSQSCEQCPSDMPYSSSDRSACLGICEFAGPTCQNGGTCKNLDGGKFTCECVGDWTGPTCEQKSQPPPLPPPPPPPPAPPAPPQPVVEYTDCIDEENDPKGLYYNGTWSTTTSGRTCQEWSRLYPHSHAYREKLGKHRNYCRNINNLAHPWCYTTDPDKVWEYCATAPTCSNPDVPVQVPPAEPGCYHRADKGTSYAGPVAYTISGKLCAQWTEFSYDFADNLCRNPNGEHDQPWCFTQGPDSCAEVCDVDSCDSPPPPPNHPCAIKEDASLCENVITLEGNCHYKFGFGDECDFTVVAESRQKYSVYLNGIDENGGPVYELHWNSIGGPRSFTDQRCQTKFEVDDFNVIKIRKPLCILCAQKSLDSFLHDITTNQKTCAAPPPLL